MPVPGAVHRCGRHHREQTVEAEWDSPGDVCLCLISCWLEMAFPPDFSVRRRHGLDPPPSALAMDTCICLSLITIRLSSAP